MLDGDLSGADLKVVCTFVVCCCTCSALLLLQALLHKGLSYVPSAFCLKEVFQGVASMEGVSWIVVWDTCGLMKDLWVAEQVGTRGLLRQPLCC